MLTKQEYALFAQLAPLPDPRSLDMTFGVFLNSSSLSSRPRLRRLRRRSSARCTNRHSLRSRPPRLCTPRARCRDRRANDLRDVLGGIRTVCLELSRVPRGRQARSCWKNGEQRASRTSRPRCGSILRSQAGTFSHALADGRVHEEPARGPRRGWPRARCTRRRGRASASPRRPSLV
jgi:hypothetical protein